MNEAIKIEDKKGTFYITNDTQKGNRHHILREEGNTEVMVDISDNKLINNKPLKSHEIEWFVNEFGVEEEDLEI